MPSELPPSALALYESRFAEPAAQLAAASIATGNTAGRLWASSGHSATASLVLWDQGNNILYLGFSPHADERALSRLVGDEIRAAAVGAGRQRFGVRALDDQTESLIPRLFGTLLSGERRTMFWAWPAGRKPGAHPVSLAGIHWEIIGSEFLASEDIAGLDEVRQEINWMWPSVERYQQSGLGSAALLERRLVCWCTAEYVGPERCGVGIATAEQYRGLGFATATAAHFVHQALARGLIPCWECGADNTPSAHVAARLGFELLEEHCTWLGQF